MQGSIIVYSAAGRITLKCDLYIIDQTTIKLTLHGSSSMVKVYSGYAVSRSNPHVASNVDNGHYRLEGYDGSKLSLHRDVNSNHFVGEWWKAGSTGTVHGTCVIQLRDDHKGMDVDSQEVKNKKKTLKNALDKVLRDLRDYVGKDDRLYIQSLVASKEALQHEIDEASSRMENNIRLMETIDQIRSKIPCLDLPAQIRLREALTCVLADIPKR